MKVAVFTMSTQSGICNCRAQRTDRKRGQDTHCMSAVASYPPALHLQQQPGCKHGFLSACCCSAPLPHCLPPPLQLWADQQLSGHACCNRPNTSAVYAEISASAANTACCRKSRRCCRDGWRVVRDCCGCPNQTDLVCALQVCGVCLDKFISRHILDRLRLVLSHFCCTASVWREERQTSQQRCSQCRKEGELGQVLGP